MLHFASDFLAQQLVWHVHVFGGKNAPFVHGDHPTPGRGQATLPPSKSKVEQDRDGQSSCHGRQNEGYSFHH